LCVADEILNMFFLITSSENIQLLQSYEHVGLDLKSEKNQA
jgi:hypothetical protein